MSDASPAPLEAITTEATALPSPLVARTVAVDPDDLPDDLLRLLPTTGGASWVRRGDGLVAWGEVARVRTDGETRFADAELAWRDATAHAVVRDEVRLPGTGLVAFGSFAFSAGSPAGGVLLVPEVVVGRRAGTAWVTTVGTAAARLPVRRAPRPPGVVRFADGARTSLEWVRAVAGAVQRIEAGEVSKVVLARDVEVRTQDPLDVRWPLRRLAHGYPACWTFAVDGLIGATPEMLVRLADGVATSRVLAGTLRRSGDATMDVRKGTALARSIKDVEEHGYGVRSVADALALHCSTVDVPVDPFVLELPNVMHLATDVTGVVADGATSLELIASLHPPAAVCGTPTEVAMDMIREVEGLDRGRYAGPVGWLNAAGDGEWGIALRCGQVDPDDPRRLRLFAGCGIVEGSKPADELAESNAKLVPMRDALGS